VHNATNLKLRLEDDAEEPAGTATASGINSPASYGTVTLDPHLENVSIDFQKTSVIGAVIVTDPSRAAPSRNLSNVTLLLDGKYPYEILEQAGELQWEQNGGQSHFFYNEGWQKKHLKREEKDYPSLVQ
jgi:hypothetical protein